MLSKPGEKHYGHKERARHPVTGMPARSSTARSSAGRRRGFSLLLSLLSLLALPGSLLGLPPASVLGESPNGWSEPQRLLPYVAMTPALCLNPANGSISYLAGSGAYGVVMGNDFDNWTNSTY
ncbi:MAG TPA: hypothetical protein VH186_09645, partial [Chloroflexia bacterium]|nr:hypothetical protein [Chloroflexia bacterium]